MRRVLMRFAPIPGFSRKESRKHHWIGILAFILLASGGSNAHRAVAGQGTSQVPASRLITFSDMLKGADGQPRIGIAGITFALYASREGGEALWRENQTVQTNEQGRYTVFIGSTEKEGLPLEVFSNGKAQWLGIQVQGEEEQPRVFLVTVPYALKAADADMVGGKPLSAFMLYEDFAQAQASGNAFRRIAIDGMITSTYNNARSFSSRPSDASIAPDIRSEMSIGAGGVPPAKSASAQSLASDRAKNSVTGTETLQYTAFGLDAGFTNSASSGTRNSYLGAAAGYRTNNGSDNTFVGHGSGYYNTAGSSNSFFGTFSGRGNEMTSFNSIFGYEAGFYNGGDLNSFFGAYAGKNNNAGAENCMFGGYAGISNGSGGNNSMFGTYAGWGNQTGSGNAFFGHSAGYSNTSASRNAFFGAFAGYTNTTGEGNVFTGRGAGYTNNGDNNSIFGYEAGYYNTTGATNSIFGYKAGQVNTTENNNSFFGAFSDGAAGIINATAIGHRAKVTQSNSLILGSIEGVNSANSDTNVGIGTTSPDRQLVIEGSQALARFTRYKHTTDSLAPTFAPAFLFERARGTRSAPLNITGGDYLGKLQFRGRVGGNMLEYGALTFISTDTNQNGRLSFVDRDMLTERVSFLNTGNVGIGTTNPAERLHVIGNIRASGTITASLAAETEVPDYVFDRGYRLMPIGDLEKYLIREKHLPNVPKGSEIKEKGVNLSEFQMKLLEKIEELTLYTVQQAKTISQKNADIAALRSKNATLDSRLAALEKLVADLAKQKERK